MALRFVAPTLVAIVLAACSPAAPPAAAPASAPTAAPAAAPTAAPAAPATTAPAAAPTSVPAPAPTAAPAAAAPVELTFWSYISDTLNEDTWNKQLERFMQTHPTIKVKQLAPPSLDTTSALKARISTGNAPDVAVELPLNDFKDSLLPYDQSDPDLKQIKNLTPLTIDGKLYGISGMVLVRNFIYYNKDLFAKAGIGDCPKTWDEFGTDLQKLNQAGTTPMMLAGEWRTARTFMILNNIFSDTPDWWVKRRSGQVHFTDDTWLKPAERFQSWVKAGYFNKGALGINYTQEVADYFQGKAAMIGDGSWLADAAQKTPPSFGMGLCAPPAGSPGVHLQGGIGADPYVIFKTTKHPAEALILAKWLAFDAGAAAALWDGDGGYSGLTIPVPRNFDALHTQIQKTIDSADSFVLNYYHASGPSAPKWYGIVDAVNVMSQNLVLEKDPKTELAQLDKLWDQNN